MKTIILGYDETPAAERALERTAELAKAFPSSVIVTSVAPALISSGPRSGGAIDPADPPERRSEQLERAKERFDQFGIDVETVVAVGDPASSIVELAERNNADLIVVGTRDLGFFERMLGQSVSAGVSRQAESDVLIVR